MRLKKEQERLHHAQNKSEKFYDELQESKLCFQKLKEEKNMLKDEKK